MKNLIKQFYSCLLLLAFSFVLVAACSSDKAPVEPNVKIPDSVLNSGLSFSKIGGVQTFSVQTNVTLEVTSNQIWCEVQYKNTTTNGTSVYEVKMDSNPDTDERTSIISVAANGEVIGAITAIQAAADGAVVETPSASDVGINLGLGWNLGNQFDAHNNGVANETCWGNQKTTQTMFDKLAVAGFTSVRIPITWLGHIGNAPGYTLESTWLERVAEVVGYAKKAGIKAIINIHHDGADSNYWLSIKQAAQSENSNTLIKAELKAIWTQIAERFKNEGSFLIFESMNEIHDGGWGWGANRTDGGKQYTILNEWNQVFVNAVRGVGGENSSRFLGIPGYCTNPDLTVQYLKMPTDKVDNRLMVAVHFYDPYEYTLNASKSEWGHTGAVDKKVSGGDEDNVLKIFKSLKETFIDKGIPVYLGEMGCVHRSTTREESFRKYYLEYVCKAAKTYGLAPFFWDNGATGAGKENSGLFNHATGAYLNNAQDIVGVMKKAIFTNDASYTLESVYNGAPK